MTDVDNGFLVPGGAVVAYLVWSLSRLITKIDEAIDKLSERGEDHQTRISVLEAESVRRKWGRTDE